MRWWSCLSTGAAHVVGVAGVADVAAIREYLEHHNADPKPFVWTATADSILERLKRVCERTSDSGH